MITSKAVRTTEKFIFGSRWLLLPVKVGLQICGHTYPSRQASIRDMTSPLRSKPLEF